MSHSINLFHSLKIGRAKTYKQRDHWLGVRVNGPYVVLLVDDKTIPLTTTQAHEAGWALVRTADDCIRNSHNGVLWDGHTAKEAVVLSVNNHSMHVSPAKARKIGGALLRKSDFADDYQIGN